MDDKLKTGARLKYLRGAKGIRRSDAAEKADISYDYLTKIENGQRHPNLAILENILKAIDSGLEEFFSGDMNFRPPRHGVPFPIEEWGLHRLNEARAVPVIGWTQAGSWTMTVSDSAASPDEIVYSDSVPEGCFALSVHGDSMEPEFHQGDVIIVDPQSRFKSGDFVVARIEGQSEATFKQLKIKDGKIALHALNPRYPDMEIDGPFETVVAGVVVESKKIFLKPDARAVSLARIIEKLSDMSDEEFAEMEKAAFGKR